MTSITLQVLDGADRGVVYDDLQTPITIGREEGNSVQLNDERISRFHIKIQEDGDKVVLTDLESTNGTRVNGQETQLRILRFGDLINVGRSMLLYGSRDQIADRIDHLKDNGVAVGDGSVLEKLTGPDQEVDPDASVSIDLNWGDSQQFPSALHLPGPPELPEGLGPAQLAQLSEIIEYFHLRTRALLHGAVAQDGQPIVIDHERWQELLDLQGQLAQYLRHIAEPGAE